MNTRRSVLRLTTPVLALGLALAFAYLAPANKLWSAAAQVTSPQGYYGVLVNQWKDSNTNVVRGFLSSLYFDGAGNVSGPYAFITINDTVLTGTMTGTYFGNPDGSNTVRLTRDVGGTLTATMAVTDGGAGIQLLVTGGGLMSPGQVFTGTGRYQSALGATPAGSYGFTLHQWPDANNEPLGILGVFDLDGAGNVIGTVTVVGPDAGPAPITSGFTGTYSINPDSTGILSLNLDIGVSVTFGIVVTDGGAGILMLEIDGSGGLGAVTSGIARLQ